MIRTGFETDQDIDDFISEVDDMIRVRNEAGANHSFQFNITPLVYYNSTALRWFARKTSVESFNNERNMGRFLDAMKERGIRAKFNGKGCGTWLEQLLLDFGPAGTDWLVGLSEDQGINYVRFFGDKVKEAAVDELAKRAYEPLFFVKERPDDWIFPSDNVDAIPKQMAKMWRDRFHKWMEGDGHAYDYQLCLRTPANLNGNKCYGCGMCHNKEEINQMVNREIWDEHTYEQVAEMLSDSREQKDVRVVVKMKPEWSIYNRTSLAHYITSRILQKNEVIADRFYNVGKTSLTWYSDKGQKGWYGGTWCFNIGLRDRVSLAEFEKVLDEVNKDLESCQIVRFIDDTKAQKCKIQCRNLVIGQTSEYSFSQLKDKYNTWVDKNCPVPVFVKSMQGSEQEMQEHPELSGKIFMAQKGNSVLISMDCTGNISPYVIMQGIIGKGYPVVLSKFAFDVIDYGEEVDMVDDKGNHLCYSYLTGKYNRKSYTEMAKIYLYQLTK